MNDPPPRVFSLIFLNVDEKKILNCVLLFISVIDENAPYLSGINENVLTGVESFNDGSNQGFGANGGSSQPPLSMQMNQMGGVGANFGQSGMPGEKVERFSRKVFVGGLPPDIDEGELSFCVVLILLTPYVCQCSVII